jgi:hypothetical protein
MITVDNLLIALDNVQSEIERAIAIVKVRVENNETDALNTTQETDVVRMQITVASMQLSALADDLDYIVEH